MKRTLCLVLTIVVCFALMVGCGKAPAEQPDDPEE